MARRANRRGSAPGAMARSGGASIVIRTRLQQLMKARGLKSNRAFARAVGVNDRRVTDWLTSRFPSAENLRQIGDRLDVSVDWLLGFEDVAMRRTQRAPVGVLSEQLDRLLSARRPASAFAPDLLGRDMGQFANELVDHWWQSELQVRATQTAEKFRELAFEIQKAIRGPLQPSAAVNEGRYTVTQCFWAAAKLESPLVSWDDVETFRFSAPASQHLFPKGGTLLRSAFPVFGGWAFLWRYSDRDLAVYIEPGPGWGAVGRVRIKQGSKKTPRFLVEISADAEAAPKSRGKRRSAGKR